MERYIWFRVYCVSPIASLTQFSPIPVAYLYNCEQRHRHVSWSEEWISFARGQQCGGNSLKCGSRGQNPHLRTLPPRATTGDPVESVLFGYYVLGELLSIGDNRVYFMNIEYTINIGSCL